jgi:hypothetical protein
MERRIGRKENRWRRRKKKALSWSGDLDKNKRSLGYEVEAGRIEGKEI